MNRYFLFGLILLFTHKILAQTPQTYTNSAGDIHLAGELDLSVLKTDTTYQGWFEQYYNAFQLSGKNTDWKKRFENTEIEIFLGTWCGDSKRWVPQLVKLWNELGLDENQLKFTALYDGEERYKQGPKGEEKGKSIHRVPTFIFKENDKEYARIVEFPVNDLETDLAQIALGYASEPNYRAATYLLELFDTDSLESIYNNVQTHFNEVYQRVGKEKELNTLGYLFETSDRFPQALLTYEINSVIFPYSPRVLNSYAEALVKNKQTDRAIEVFQRVVALEPTFESAVAKLKELEEEKKD
ncbi:hypothetical protein SAMN04489724_0720 [Algoriphagus locisalis]|uniref:Uncharacterized protein n=1 Tax=Algoriphagus locisalis TaxID=305507 RepID=A0A1I6XXZ2_9BACT|nr:thioredoxin family protein [Algoriphagus locisalis]SFT42997.1 hypothetical protein SAMN04489724_0720 [Algoriphagus locisalis]